MKESSCIKGNGSDSELFKCFLEILHCRMELTQYVYPFEFFEEDKVIKEHISKCKKIFKLIMAGSIIDAFAKRKKILSRADHKIIFKKLKKDLFILLDPHIKIYFTTVVVKYVDYNDGHKR